MRSLRPSFNLVLGTMAVTALALLGPVAPASAGPLPPTFEVLDVVSTGCLSGNFELEVERANFTGGTYNVITVVTVDELIYMNERAFIGTNGLTPWNLFDNFSDGAVPNPGTWPIPSDTEMRVDFSLEQPLGTVLYEWTLIVDGCNTGNVIYNGLTADVPVPPETTTTTEPTTTTTEAPATTEAPTTTAAAAPAVVAPRFTG